ncbi:MAG: hypothetical protein Q9219_005101 [cf. Caloplaca sp. 3 TL-2023]
MDMFSLLPEELHRAILDDLDVTSLKQLSQVSSVFLNRSRPRLYRSVVFSSEKNDSQNPPPLENFLRVLLTDPARRKLVMRFTLVGRLQNCRWRKPASLDRTELALAAQLLRDVDLETTARLLGALETDDGNTFDATVALLLLLLPDLQSVDIGVCFVQFNPLSLMKEPVVLIPAMFRHLIGIKHQRGHWHKLEQVVYYGVSECADNDDIPSFTDVLWLFRIPSIKSITARAVDFGHPLHLFLDAPTLPALHTLNLRHSSVTLQTLETLLSWLPNLRHLEYSSYCFCSDPAEDDIDCKRLRTVLETRAGTLETLILSMVFDCREKPTDFTWRNAPHRILGRLGDMNRFHRLKYLEAPIVLLLGSDPSTPVTLADDLPPSLREFCCSSDMFEFDSLLWNGHRNLAMKRVESFLIARFGILERFTARSRFGQKLWANTRPQHIQAVCNKGGIAYQLIKDRVP